MDLSVFLRNLILLRVTWTLAGLEQGNSTNDSDQTETVFCVPGEVAMLKTTLLSPDVFNFTSTPFNITWIKSRTGQIMANRTGRVLVLQETLWFLNTTTEDEGQYNTIVRSPSGSYKQSTELVVDLPNAGKCGRPRKTDQRLTKGVRDILSCPLEDYITKLDQYNVSSNIRWYKGCDHLLDGIGAYTYKDRHILAIQQVDSKSTGTYTCTLTFTLDGVTGSVSESINASIEDKYNKEPELIYPTGEMIKAELGSKFIRTCVAFIPCRKCDLCLLSWEVRSIYILNDKSQRIYTSENRRKTTANPEGVWLEKDLIFTEVTKEDFNLDYTCKVDCGRGNHKGFFTLIPAEPNLFTHIGSVIGSVTLLFVISIIIIYHVFRVDVVLWFRRTFAVLYKSSDADGKLYDAYVAYSEPRSSGFREEVENFALHVLPEVLEQACGYKLFIPGRDCLPGHATADSVDENLQASRCIILLYSASTFSSKHSSNNNNVCKSADGSEGKHEAFNDTRQQLECVLAMHRALLEGSLRVVLVELERVTAAQLALFPESVRHLRSKQGAVCWWKAQETRRSRRGGGEAKSPKPPQTSPCLSPSSRFWKEMQYQMLVRGKRRVHPEKTALLHV